MFASEMPYKKILTHYTVLYLQNDPSTSSWNERWKQYTSEVITNIVSLKEVLQNSFLL